MGAVQTGKVEMSFTNELGNFIRVSVAPAKGGQHTVRVEGPNSVAENTVTKLELDSLYSVLGMYMNSRPEPKIELAPFNIAQDPAAMKRALEAIKALGPDIRETLIGKEPVRASRKPRPGFVVPERTPYERGRYDYLDHKTAADNPYVPETEAFDDWARGREEMAAVAAQFPPGERCHADRDGECVWHLCPQLRDGESAKSGRHCPLDLHDEEP